jgi:hypothetical protein
MTRRFPSICSALAAAAMALGLAGAEGVAQAQTSTTTTSTLTVGVNPSSLITHTLPGGGDFTRSATLNPLGVNFEDCERNVVLNFPLLATGTASSAAGYALYAYAGSNCDQGGAAVSPGVAGGTCWPVVNGPISYNLNAGFVVPIPVRQILSQYTLSVKEPYSAASTTDDSICHIQPTSAEFNITVYFVFGTSMSLATVGGAGNQVIDFDLAAAAPPTSLTVGIGSTVLLPSWNSITDQDIVGYNVYYLPAGAPASATPMTICPNDGGGDDSGNLETQGLGTFTLSALDDGGDGGDDGSDEGGTTTTTTTSTDSGLLQGCYVTTPINATPLADAGVPYHPNGVDCPSPFPAGSTSSETDAGDIAGTDADIDNVDTTTSEDGSVGTISTAASVAALSMQPREAVSVNGVLQYPFVAATGNTATSATISNLNNDTEYVVGVAATDAYGNVGALSTFNGSDMICQWPQQVTDFFDSYRAAGGEAGCALDAPEVPSGAGGSALVFGAALVFALRRRRR